jgi:uncharacterized membrane protein (UPF0127 family)
MVETEGSARRGRKRVGSLRGGVRLPFSTIGGAVLCMLLFFAVLRPAPCGALETTTITVGPVALTVEVADDPFERSVGLMYRESLPLDRGMLFVYPDEQPRAFWMKNTTIPLSIAFADARGLIIAIMDMAPDDGAVRYRSGGPAMYALEVNRGWFARNGVKIGDRIVVDGR